MSSENVDLVRRIYEVGRCGEAGALMELMDPEIEIHEAESMPYRGIYRGHAGVGELFQLINSLLLDFLVTPEAFFDGGDRVAALIRLTARARQTGKPLDMKVMELWTLRNGKALVIQPFYWDTAEVSRIVLAI